MTEASGATSRSSGSQIHHTFAPVSEGISASAPQTEGYLIGAGKKLRGVAGKAQVVIDGVNYVVSGRLQYQMAGLCARKWVNLYYKPTKELEEQAKKQADGLAQKIVDDLEKAGLDKMSGIEASNLMKFTFTAFKVLNNAEEIGHLVKTVGEGIQGIGGLAGQIGKTVFGGTAQIMASGEDYLKQSDWMVMRGFGHVARIASASSSIAEQVSTVATGAFSRLGEIFSGVGGGIEQLDIKKNLSKEITRMLLVAKTEVQTMAVQTVLNIAGTAAFTALGIWGTGGANVATMGAEATTTLSSISRGVSALSKAGFVMVYGGSIVSGAKMANKLRKEKKNLDQAQALVKSILVPELLSSKLGMSTQSAKATSVVLQGILFAGLTSGYIKITGDPKKMGERINQTIEKIMANLKQ